MIHSPGRSPSGQEPGTKLSPRKTILLDTELVTRLCQARNISQAIPEPAGSRHLSFSLSLRFQVSYKKGLEAEGQAKSEFAQKKVHTDAYAMTVNSSKKPHPP